MLAMTTARRLLLPIFWLRGCRVGKAVIATETQRDRNVIQSSLFDLVA
jgi:hypothetical protein